MGKTKFILSLFILLLLTGCSPDLVPPLGGSYDSGLIQGDGIFIQMAIQPEENTFVEYISNREVDRGTIEEKSDNIYLFKGQKQDFEITLSPDDSFTVTVNQLNGGKPIELKNTDKVPTYFSTEFKDVEEYEELLAKDSEENSRNLESKASQYLSGQTFNKHTGDGADRLLFVGNDRLIISVEDQLPPYIVDLDEFEDYEGNETIELKNIELKDSDSGEFLVIYDGEELFKFVSNEDGLLETEDGTTYMKN